MINHIVVKCTFKIDKIKAITLSSVYNGLNLFKKAKLN